jgi:hypothetical protein
MLARVVRVEIKPSVFRNEIVEEYWLPPPESAFWAERPCSPG